jgi:glutathione S-transferase
LENTYFFNMLGKKVERHDIDLLNGEHKSEAFLAINPAGQVPTLVDGDITISDSVSMSNIIEGNMAYSEQAK